MWTSPAPEKLQYFTVNLVPVAFRRGKGNHIRIKIHSRNDVHFDYGHMRL